METLLALILGLCLSAAIRAKSTTGTGGLANPVFSTGTWRVADRDDPRHRAAGGRTDRHARHRLFRHNQGEAHFTPGGFEELSVIRRLIVALPPEHRFTS